MKFWVPSSNKEVKFVTPSLPIGSRIDPPKRKTHTHEWKWNYPQLTRILFHFLFQGIQIVLHNYFYLKRKKVKKRKK